MSDNQVHVLAVTEYGLAGLAILAFIAMIGSLIATAPRRSRQAEFFARKRREAAEEWKRQEKGSD